MKAASAYCFTILTGVLFLTGLNTSAIGVQLDPTQCSSCCNDLVDTCCAETRCQDNQDDSATARSGSSQFKENSTASSPKAPPSAGVCPVPALGKRISSSSEIEQLRQHANTPIFTRCMDATKALLSNRNAAMQGLSLEGQSLAQDYADTCFSAPMLIHGSDLTSAELDELRNNLMLLVRPKDTDVWCHGFRIGNHVLTSLHCLRAEDDQHPIEVFARTVGSPELLPTVEVLPNDGGKLNVEDNQSRDYALLRLSTVVSEPNDRGLDWLGDPVEIARIIVVQSNIYVRHKLALDSSADLTPSVRVQHSSFCRLVAATPEGYLLHSCATEHGTSGAPLFQRGADGRLRLIGVHAGATSGLTASPQWQACRRRAENYGVRPSTPEIRNALLRAH